MWVLPATPTAATGLSQSPGLDITLVFLDILKPMLLCVYVSVCLCVCVSLRPSHILLSCGVPDAVAANALRLSVGRTTTTADVDAVVEDLKEAVQLLSISC